MGNGQFQRNPVGEYKAAQPGGDKDRFLSGCNIPGRVDSIQAGTGSRFSLLPPEDATGNFVKVVQQVQVKIVFDQPYSDHLLAVGMSVVPSVKIN